MTNSPSDALSDERGGMPSASGIESLFLCKGKFLAEKGLPDIEYSESSEGTIRHALAEMDMPADEIDDPERARAVTNAKLAVMELKSKTIQGEGYLLKEQRMWLRDSKGVPFLSGKPDYVEIVPQYKRALIVDYKMLYGEHSPAHANPQLFTLAALVMQENKSIQECYIALVTPLLEPLYSVSMLDRETVKAWAGKLHNLSKAIQNPNAPRVAGAKQCKYCRALPFCPEARQLLNETMDKTIEEISKDPDELGKAYALAAMYEKFAASVKATVRTKLKEDPKSVEGYKLGRGLKIASYDTQKALEVLRDRDFDIEEMDKFVKLQERNLIKVWAEKTGLTMAKAKTELRDIMKAHNAVEVKESTARILKHTPKKED